MLNASVLKAIGIGTALTALGGCMSLSVRTDVNPAMSAANCHTYGFAKEHVANAEAPSAWGNPLNAERLRLAIESNMAARGIPKSADPKAADCVVGYAMGTRQVFDDFYGGWGPGFGWGGGWGAGWRGGWGGWGGGWGYDEPYVRDETRIAIDLFDARARTPIWHASVSQSVSDLRGPYAEQKIGAATAAIFAKFPVAAPMPAPGSVPQKTAT